MLPGWQAQDASFEVYPKVTFADVRDRTDAAKTSDLAVVFCKLAGMMPALPEKAATFGHHFRMHPPHTPCIAFADGAL